MIKLAQRSINDILNKTVRFPLYVNIDFIGKIYKANLESGIGEAVGYVEEKGNKVDTPQVGKYLIYFTDAKHQNVERLRMALESKKIYCNVKKVRSARMSSRGSFLVNNILETIKVGEGINKARIKVPSNQDDLKAEVVKKVTELAVEDPDLHAGNVELHVSRFLQEKGVYVIKQVGIPQGVLDELVLGLHQCVSNLLVYSQEDFLGSTGDYFVSVFTRGVKELGYMVILNSAEYEVGADVKSGIRNSALRPQEEWGRVYGGLKHYAELTLVKE